MLKFASQADRYTAHAVVLTKILSQFDHGVRSVADRIFKFNIAMQTSFSPNTQLISSDVSWHRDVPVGADSQAKPLALLSLVCS